MSKPEILAELPRLSEPERAEIFECLWDLEGTSGPTEHEKAVLKKAQAEYDANPDDGSLGLRWKHGCVENCELDRTHLPKWSGQKE